MSEENIPIDIHSTKLLDWLINRRHCQQQWQGAALEIREKINLAIQDMPEHPEITKLLKGTHINYFHCKRIIEILRETEAATKNIFGRYSSQRMKDWQEIVKLYEQNDVYLAEAAQLLQRNVSFEVPALKKQIARCQQAQNDCTKKEGEYAASSSELKEKYYSECKKLGIKGNKVKKEIVDLVRDLPSTYTSYAKKAKHLKPAVELYSEFVAFTLNNNELRNECVPLLKYFIDNGNTTTFEWKHGKVPSKVLETTLDFGQEDDYELVTEESNEIDFGAIEDIPADGIDYSGIQLDDIEGVGGDEGDIDWGISTDDGVQIEVVDESLNVDTSDLDMEDVAVGEDALTLLDNPKVRNALIDEMLETECFLSQRLQEMKAESDVISGSTFESAPSILHTSAADIQKLLSNVTDLVASLSIERLQDLFLIRNSPRYVDRLAEKLKKIISDSEKLMSRSRLMVTKREESSEEEVSLGPKVDLIRSRTRELQKHLEQEISKKYKNRKVNIMGEINTM